MLRRRTLLAASTLVPTLGRAAAYPSQPVRVVVPFAPGGPTDAIARQVALGLSKELKQSFVIENRPGAQGLIGTVYVKDAKADGYTLLFNELTATFAIQPAIAKKPPFNSQTDFTPISAVGTGPIFLHVNANSRATNLAQLIELSKASPRGLSYGSSGGMGQMPSHVGPELLKLKYGLQSFNVVYKGSAPAMVDLAAGSVDFMMTTGLVAALPFIQSGKVRPLAVAGTAPVPGVSVATFASQGFPVPELDKGSVFGLLGPAKLPADVVEVLAKATAKVVESEEMKHALATQTLHPVKNPGPEALKALMRDDTATWPPIIKRMNISTD